MSFWIPEGGGGILVGASGNPINCDVCPCDSIPVPTDTCCPDYPGTIQPFSSAWTFEMTGVTNSACSDCTTYLNKTFNLYNVDVNECTAYGDPDDFLGFCVGVIGADGYVTPWVLGCGDGEFFGGNAYMVLYLYDSFNFTYVALYRILKSAWDGTGPNTLDLYDFGYCSNFPATITVTPI